MRFVYLPKCYSFDVGFSDERHHMQLLQGKGPYCQGLRETQEQKKEKEAQKGKPTQKKTYPKCSTCGKTNHPEERCWQGAGAHLKPKRTRPEDASDNDPDSKASKPHYKPTSSSSQTSSSKDDHKN